MEREQLESAVSRLKRVLTQEYASFFDPMVDSWSAENVSFDDPMTSLTGLDSYWNNVDMLTGRTVLGRVLFCSATRGSICTRSRGGTSSRGATAAAADWKSKRSSRA